MPEADHQPLNTESYVMTTSNTQSASVRVIRVGSQTPYAGPAVQEQRDGKTVDWLEKVGDEAYPAN